MRYFTNVLVILINKLIKTFIYLLCISYLLLEKQGIDSTKFDVMDPLFKRIRFRFLRKMRIQLHPPSCIICNKSRRKKSRNMLLT